MLPGLMRARIAEQVDADLKELTDLSALEAYEGMARKIAAMARAKYVSTMYRMRGETDLASLWDRDVDRIRKEISGKGQ